MPYIQDQKFNYRARNIAQYQQLHNDLRNCKNSDQKKAILRAINEYEDRKKTEGDFKQAEKVVKHVEGDLDRMLDEAHKKKR